MRICTYLESKEVLAKTGIMSAYRNQRRALAAAGLEVTEDPTGSYDVLHLHWIGPKSYYHFRQAKRQGLPVVVTAHSTAETSKGSVTFSELINPLVKSYMRHLYDNVDLVVAPSPYTKASLQDQGINSPIRVVSNGIDAGRFSPDPDARARFRKRFGLSRFTVLSVGQIIPRKGVVDFLDVAESLPDFEFVWLGERLSPWLSFYPQMHRRVERAPDHVRFPGFVKCVEEAYAGADLFLFTSLEETQGMVVLEAAAMGLPMVIRDIPVFRDWLLHGEHCLKGYTAAELAAHIRTIAANPALRARMSERLVQLARSHRLDRLGDQYRDLYGALLEGRVYV